MARGAVSIGSNLERESNLKSAIIALGKVFGILSLSPIYESEAFGFKGPPFYNLVAIFDTLLDVRAVRTRIRAIEKTQGREMGTNRSGSRSLDLDILLYDNAIFYDEGLDVPREEILRHSYILKPLADLLPEAPHPVTGESFGEIWGRLGSQQEVLSIVDDVYLN